MDERLIFFTVVLLYAVVMAFLMRIYTKVKHVRFSLQSLLYLVLYGGACATLLSDPSRQLRFAYGVVGLMVFVAFIIAYVISSNELAELQSQNSNSVIRTPEFSNSTRADALDAFDSFDAGI